MISGNAFSNWWKNTNNLLYTYISDNIEECVFFGFPGTWNDVTLNFCILYAKYYIYIQKLSNSNKINFVIFLTI